MLEEGVGADPVAAPLEVDVKPQALRQRLGAGAQGAAERRVGGDHPFPFGERLLPGGVGREQAAQVPGVGGGDLGTGRHAVGSNGGHGNPRKERTREL